MTDADRELFELAAKAAGTPIRWASRPMKDHDGYIYHQVFAQREGSTGEWNPRDDDGDALRLAVAIGLFTTSEGLAQFQAFYSDEIARDNKPTAATRRAILFIAAEIGRALP